MRRVLITGANGLLGQKLIELFERHKDFKVFATSRGPSRLEKLPVNVEYQALDVSNESQIRAVVDYFEPDTVINTAAMTNVDECEQNRVQCEAQNVHAVDMLARVCLEKSIFLVQLSTDFIFDGASGPYSEEDSPNPISFYGETKLRAEQILANIPGLQYSIVRTVLVYGVAKGLSRTNIILWAKSNLEQKKHIKVVTDQWRTPTLAEDLAEGIFLITNNKETGVYNICGEDMMTPYDMAMETARFFKLDKKYIESATAATFSQPAQRPPKTGLRIDKAKTVLGYKPRSFADGLKILATQLKNTGIH
jgi:dTDP-4-dehydrorhamnose reductase